MTRRPAPLDAPPAVPTALAVCAHPDDESFGLGATLAALVGAVTAIDTLCFTRGEASTVGRVDDRGKARCRRAGRAPPVAVRGVREVQRRH